MVDVKKIRLPLRLSSAAFERLVDAIGDVVGREAHPAKVVMDLAGTEYADLLELMCLIPAARYLEETAGASVLLHFSDLADLTRKFKRLARSDALSALSRKRRLSARMKRLVGFLRYCDYWRLRDGLLANQIGNDLSVSSSAPGGAGTRVRRGGRYIFLPMMFVDSRADLDRVYEEVRGTIASYLAGIPDSVFAGAKPVRGPDDYRMDVVDSLARHVAYEVTDNILEHAYVDAPYGVTTGIVAMRHIGRPENARERVRRVLSAPKWLHEFVEEHLDTDLLEVCVSDGGAGLSATLAQSFRRRHRSTTCSEPAVIEWAFSEESSTRSDSPDEQKGMGLHWAQRHVVDCWRGCLYLRTGHTRWVDHPFLATRRPLVEPGLTLFPGTQYRLLLPLRENWVTTAGRIRELGQQQLALGMGAERSCDRPEGM